MQKLRKRYNERVALRLVERLTLLKDIQDSWLWATITASTAQGLLRPRILYLMSVATRSPTLLLTPSSKDVHPHLLWKDV